MNNQTVEIEMMKLCSKCKIEKLKNNFHKNKPTKDGLDDQCTIYWKQNFNEKLIKIKKLV